MEVGESDRINRQTKALDLCQKNFPQKEAFPDLIGVTGTNGKTTTTFLIRYILSQLGMRVGLMGTVATEFEDYKISTGLTTPGSDVFFSTLREFTQRGALATVIEVSSHALDQARIYGSNFVSTVFTNLTQDHLDYHETMESYFQSKCRLFRDYTSKTKVLGIDDPYVLRLAQELHTDSALLTYGTHSSAHYQILSSQSSAQGLELIVSTPKVSKIILKPKLLGFHNALNLLAAWGACSSYLTQLHATEISSILNSVPSVPGRFEIIWQRPLIVVDYAHTPDALLHALRTLREIQHASSDHQKGQLLVAFGCGGDRDASKRPIMGSIASQLADQVILTQDNPRTENPEKIISDILQGIPSSSKNHSVKTIQNRRQALEETMSSLRPEDILLIAGKGHEDYQILGTEKIPLDDRRIVREMMKHLHFDT